MIHVMNGSRPSQVAKIRGLIVLFLTALSTFARSAPTVVVRTPSGVAETVSVSGSIDRNGPFFQPLGSNGRSCASCHVPEEGWTVTPAGLKSRFEKTEGLDPVFRSVDGANSPDADVSTLDRRRQAYSMLLDKGLIRVGLPVPAAAEFELIGVDDPYGHASTSDVSLFRRPLPSTNLRFLSTVMWDGRETVVSIRESADLTSNLAHQAADAIAGHAQGTTVPSQEQIRQIVEFEMGLYTAQAFDDDAGNLTARGVHGGPENLSTQEFFIGINDPLGGNPTGEAFRSESMDLFASWLNGPGRGGREFGMLAERGGVASARQAVARGEKIFNTRTFGISGVTGLNDVLDISVLQATCTTCHNAPNAGNHSVSLALNIGLADESRRTPDLPLYTLRNRFNGDVVRTTDPGRAMITGKWSDIGKFKGPVLRALATRAPYFHNGSAAGLAEVVDFYNKRFQIGFSEQEKADLVAFLKTL